MPLTQELLSIGLENKEADVYLSALQLGYSTVQEIAIKSGVNRTTAYTHIKNLIGRGLMSAVEKNGKVFYVAERPEKLKFIYEQKENEIKRRRETLEKIMPELESIYNLAKDKPSVRFYKYDIPEDLAAVRREIEELRADEVYNIFNYEEFHDYINKAHIRNLIDATSKFRALYIGKNKVIDLRVRPFMDEDKFKLRFLPEAKFGFLCEVLVARDMVYIAGNSDWLVIKDKLFAHTLTLLFQALWGIAEAV